MKVEILSGKPTVTESLGITDLDGFQKKLVSVLTKVVEVGTGKDAEAFSRLDLAQRLQDDFSDAELLMISIMKFDTDANLFVAHQAMEEEGGLTAEMLEGLIAEKKDKEEAIG